MMARRQRRAGLMLRAALLVMIVMTGSARAQAVSEIAPGDGEAGIAAIVDRRNQGGCVIALGLQHRTGRTRDWAMGEVEVFTSTAMSEVLTATWRFTDEGRARWVEVFTARPCQQRPRIVVRSLRLCPPQERAALCEPALVPFRPGSRRPLPWLEVTYRTSAGGLTPEDLQNLRPAR
jgi:hypothetical protein